MTATYTLRYTEYAGVAGLEEITAWTKELPLAAKTGLMIVAAPLLGLAFVIALPIAGLVLAAWMGVKKTAIKWPRAAQIVKRIALFAVAPFFGLTYFIAFPFVGLGALAYYAMRAARR